MSTKSTQSQRKSKKVKEPTPELVEDDEEEYEVDEIKDDKRLPDGSIQYLVSWVGYGPEDDLWIPEDNMSGCEDKMKAYWAAKPRRSNQPNKAAARKIEKSGKGKRDSVASGSTLHTNGTMSKKRGRPSKISVVETDEEDRTSKKKKRKANDVDAPDAEDWADHQLADTLPAVANRTFKALHVQYKHLKNWESKVDSIDTILQRPPQYPGEGHLVAINWHSDFYSWVPTTVANMKCPQKVIEFYERNLTFKNAEGDDVEGSEEPEEVGHRGMELVEEQIKEVEMVGE